MDDKSYIDDLIYDKFDDIMCELYDFAKNAEICCIDLSSNKVEYSYEKKSNISKLDIEKFMILLSHADESTKKVFLKEINKAFSLIER